MLNLERTALVSKKQQVVWYTRKRHGFQGLFQNSSVCNYLKQIKGKRSCQLRITVVVHECVKETLNLMQSVRTHQTLTLPHEWEGLMRLSKPSLSNVFAFTSVKVKKFMLQKLMPRASFFLPFLQSALFVLLMVQLVL